MLSVLAAIKGYFSCYNFIPKYYKIHTTTSFWKRTYACPFAGLTEEVTRNIKCGSAFKNIIIRQRVERYLSSNSYITKCTLFYKPKVSTYDDDLQSKRPQIQLLSIAAHSTGERLHGYRNVKAFQVFYAICLKNYMNCMNYPQFCRPGWKIYSLKVSSGL